MAAALSRVYAGLCRRDRLISKECPFWLYLFWACTKRRNVETKRPKRNGRNHRNDRNDRNETKRPKRNDRNETTETTETKRPKRNGRKYKLQENGKY